MKKRLIICGLTGRDEGQIALTEAYARRRACGALPTRPIPSSLTRLNLTWVQSSPALAGPKRPQDKVILTEVDDVFNADLASTYKHDGAKRVAVEGEP